MNLKEVFRCQNKLHSFMDQALDILNHDSCVKKVENICSRCGMLTEIEDKMFLNIPETGYFDNITDLARFLLLLLIDRVLKCGRALGLSRRHTQEKWLKLDRVPA